MSEQIRPSRGWTWIDADRQRMSEDDLKARLAEREEFIERLLDCLEGAHRDSEIVPHIPTMYDLLREGGRDV